MLHSELLNKGLENKKEDFEKHVAEQAQETRIYLDALKRLEASDQSDILRICEESDSVGALPADELAQNRSFASSFAPVWQNHEQARTWALAVLKDRTTFAVDGSQMFLEKETSMPIGAVQIGWFENPHDGSQNYVKNAEFTILTPTELLIDQEEPLNPDTRVGEVRFHSEVAKASEFLTSKKGWQARGERMPLAFFDGTLLVSFSLPQTGLQDSFIRAMVNLVRHSRDCKVPLVGYVDRSFSRDVISLLGAFASNTDGKRSLYDTAVLHTNLPGLRCVLDHWGARTSYCYSRRKGLEAFIDPQSGRSLVGFTYLQTTADSGSARLDVPSWIYEEGLLNEVIDVVRAECVVGLGYPYALETADQVAVISFRDREIFLSALQGFAVREKLGFNVARKAASKDRRR